MKLNDLLSNNNVTVYGFEAFKNLESNKQADTNVILSTDSPAIMADRDIYSYFAPVLPRGVVFKTPDEITAADLDINNIIVLKYPSWELVNEDNIIIVSRHQGTIDILQTMYPFAPVISGNVTPDIVDNKHVIGTLPPHMISFCRSYRAVTIDNFDYVKDGDLDGEELKSRVRISDPISVVID